MNIEIVKDCEITSRLYLFLNKISDKLYSNIFLKFKNYQSYGDIYSCSSLKILNPKIWKYKGTIYKLRVDSGKESARIFFMKWDDRLIILHGFLKNTQKTPKKEAHQAIAVYLNRELLETMPFHDR